ncbi:MAG: Ig-like domain-containing protein [Candidatus Acidiferrales bacterium]
MKSTFAVLCAMVSLCAGILSAGCGSTPNVTVTITSPNGPQTVEAGQTLNITALAANSDGFSVGDVTWSLGGEGCGGTACGTLTGATGTSAAYKAPLTPPAANITVEVIATSTTVPSKSASLPITVEAISVQIQNKVTQLAASSSRYSWIVFYGNVKNDPNSQGVTWSLTANGIPCSPACGTISLLVGNDLQYQPPATATAAPNNTATLTASSVSDPTKSDSDTFTIFDGATACGTGGSESELNGQYAIMLRGWVGTGSTATPMLFAASFGADGTGKITNGQDQFNPFSNYSYTNNIVASSSSYSVGADNRGCLTLTDEFNDSTFTFQFSLGGASAGVASRGNIIFANEQSSSQEHAGGILRQQDLSAFSLSALASNYAIGVDGWENTSGPLTHYSLAGSFAENGGTLSNPWLDANDGGSMHSFISTGSADNFGTIQPLARLDGISNATIQIPGKSVDNANVVIYVINASEFFIVSFDLPGDGPVFAGRAVATSSSFTPASIAPTYIFRTTGSSAGLASAAIGLLNFSGSSVSGTVSGQLDSYAVGAAGNQSVSGTYAFTLASGRLAVTGASSATSPICYLTNPFDNVAAFCIGTDSAASLGVMDTQPAATYGNSSLSGNFFFGTGEPADDTAPDLSGAATISSGTLTGIEDTSTSSGLSLGAPINSALAVNSDGTGTMGPNTVLVTNGMEIYFINEASGAPAEVQIFQQ